MLVAVMLPLTVAAADKHTATIDHVTIFTNGAQVERSKSVNLNAGEQVVTFTGLSPYLDTKSMQLKAKGQVTVLGVSHRTAYPDSAQQVKHLHQAEESVKALQRSIQLLKDEKEAVKAQKELVKTNCSVAGRTVATPLVGIKELNAYYSQEMTALNKRMIELDTQEEKYAEELVKKQHERDSIARVRLTTVTEVDVKVDVRRAGRVDFNLTYYVKNAGWTPSYDVRSSSTSEPLQLSYKASVYQKTGEKWDNVLITLSSANPSRSNVVPTLGTYWLDFSQPAATYSTQRKTSARGKEAVAMLERRAEPVEDAMPELEESTVIEVGQQKAQFGYEFDIKKQLSIPSTGKSITTEIARYELPATYEYRGVPKLDKDAFLMAYATKWNHLNLLEGEANVYFDNSFVGKSILDPNVASDTLNFSMGRDQAIRLQRVKVNDSSSRRFIGSNQEQTLTWRITVKNTRQEKAVITVEDQTPVSRNSDISVTVEEVSGGMRNDNTGIVKWKLDLQPGEQREMTLKYKVKYPKSRRLTIE